MNGQAEREGKLSVKSVGMSSREMGGCSPPAAGSILRLVTGGRACRRKVAEASASWRADHCSNGKPMQLDTSALDQHGTIDEIDNDVRLRARRRT